jgi:hypothetical protein
MEQIPITDEVRKELEALAWREIITSFRGKGPQILAGADPDALSDEQVILLGRGFALTMLTPFAELLGVLWAHGEVARRNELSEIADWPRGES